MEHGMFLQTYSIGNAFANLVDFVFQNYDVAYAIRDYILLPLYE